MTLRGNKIDLRALEPSDLDFVYDLENDESVWEVSQTQTPYSKFLIKQYLENAQQDIYEAKQLRLAICQKNSNYPIGLIDIFEFDPKNNRCGIGILIQSAKNRQLGFGQDALEVLLEYAFRHLNLNQIFANIAADNLASRRLFGKFGFEIIGTKKKWNLVNGVYKDEIMFQKLMK